MIDTGIDYLNEEFMTADNKTRILNIWDQTIQSEIHQRTFLTVPNILENKLMKLLMLKIEEKIRTILFPHVDDVGHGTETAGIIGGGGRRGIIGVAPDVSLP